ncbi:MAG: hypothetical protein AAB518_02055 [Patescibacteria group bacterium]
MSLEELQEHFFRLYGRRNRIFLPSLIARIGFLNLAIGDLEDAIRKTHNRETYQTAITRTIARIFCVAEYFRALPVVPLMCQKYPASHCSYCGHFPCHCEEHRPDPTLVDLGTQEPQLSWGFRDWQLHFDRLYGEKNRDRGVEYVLTRLFKEVSELLSLAMAPTQGDSLTTLQKIEEAFALELADTFAWTIAVTNFYDIDLDQAIRRRYGTHCPKCTKLPCECKEFRMHPVNWALPTQ